MFTTHLLFSIFFFKKFIFPNFLGPQNLKLTHVDKKNNRKCFLNIFQSIKIRNCQKMLMRIIFNQNMLFQLQ
jgi:hypothetical protein